MSTKKTTTSKTTAAKAPAKKPAAPKAPAKKEAPKAKAPEQTPFDALFNGLPKNPKECTAEQVKKLSTRYAPVKASFTTAEQAKVREYGLAASAAVKARAGKATEASAVTDKEIQDLINEMNTVMDLEPLIIFGEDHMGRITTEAKDLRDADFDSKSPKCFTLAARATFRKLNIALPGEKAAKKVAAKAEKAAGKKPGAPRTTNGAPCSKSVVYIAWKKGQTDAAKLVELPGVCAQLNTIRGWVSAWKNGKNLPAIAAQAAK